ncbi:MAG: T9SS type A sorting domain-containing protein, partial [Bacteroidota bacterium]
NAIVFAAIICTILNKPAQAQNMPCGPVAENFNTSGGMAGFTSSTVNSTSAGFSFSQQGQNGFLQRCAVPSGGTVFEITTPTYQTFASQTAVGYGFDLTGAVIVSRTVVLLQYRDNTGNINSVEVANFAPSYDATGGGGLAAECRSVAINSYTGFTPGEAYRFIFQFTAASSSQNNQCIVFDNFRTTGSNSAIILPVSFTGINAKRLKNSVEIIWNVAGEKEVARYEIERSSNGSDFSKVGEVAATGGAGYFFNDVHPFSGVTFYRIKNVDADGKTKYSGIVKLKENSASSGSMKVYPNPATTHLIAEHGTIAANAKLKIIAPDGKTIKTILPNNGVANTQLDVSSLSPGMYIIKLEDVNGKVRTTFFVKQ